MKLEGDDAHEHEIFSGTSSLPYFACVRGIRPGRTHGLTAEDSLRREPGIHIVTAQAQGLPGVPQTGSDPHPGAILGNSQSLTPWPWLVGALAVVVLGAGIATWQRRVKL